MKLSYFILSLLVSFGFFSFELKASALDVLSAPQKLNPDANLHSEKDCDQCIQYRTQGRSECSLFNDFLVSETLQKSLYSMMIKNELLNACSTYLKSETSLEIINANLRKDLGHSYSVNLAELENCFLKNNITFKDPNFISKESALKTLTGYLHTLNKNILDNQLDAIKEMASIDRILGKSPLADVKCKEDYHEACESIRKCQTKNESMDDVTDLTLDGLKKIMALEKQNAELHSYSNSKKLTKEQLEEAKKDIEEKIRFNYSMMPWLSGDEVKSQLRFIKNKLNHYDETSAKQLFESAYTKQLDKGRKVLKERYLKSLVDQNCLQNNLGCNSKVLEDLNDYVKKSYVKNTNSIEKAETNNVLGNASCVAKLLSGKKEVDDTLNMTASVGLGLFTGGVGGVRALGQIALKFYQTGNRVKGMSAISLLGADGKVTYDSAQTSYDNCQKALAQLSSDTFSNDHLSQSCQEKGKNQFKISDLKTCMIDASLTVGSAALAMRSTKVITKTDDSSKAVATSKTEMKRALMLKGLTNSRLTEEDKLEIVRSLEKLNLDEASLSKTISKLNETINSDLDKNRMKNYLNYVQSLRKEGRQKAIDQIHEVALITDKFIPGGFVQKFYTKESKFYKYEIFKRDSIKKQLMKDGKSEADATKEAESLARLSRSQLQSKYYACQSKTPTPEHAVAAKRFMGLATALAPGVTAYNYTKSNADKFEEDPAKWFGKLGYDMALTYILTKLSVEMITKSPTPTVVDRYMKASVRTGKVGVVDAVLYSKLYGVSEEEARKKVEEILQSQDAEKELKTLDAYINKTGLIDKFKDSIVDKFRKILSSKNKEELMGTPPYTLAIDSFSDLKEEDLKKPEVKEKLVKAVLLQMNTGDLSSFISTDLGDKGAERLFSDRAWTSTVGIPKAIVVGLTTFQVLCVGADEPMKSMAAATGILTLNQVLSAKSYAEFKKELIGQ